MAFRVRVLHSLLLGLAGFSLVLCSFFYATPVALRYGEPIAAAAAASSGTAASTVLGSNPASTTATAASASAATEDGSVDTSSAGGKRSLQASDELSRPSGQAQEAKADVAALAAAQTSQSAENKTTTDHSVNSAANGASSAPSAAASSSGVASPVASLQPEEAASQPAAPVSTAAVDAAPPKTAANSSSRQSVIQRITPKVSNTNTKGSVADFTSLGIVTKSMYESGHDVPNAELCQEFGKSLKVVVLITSAPNHGEARMAIRQTWGHYAQRKDIAIAFLIGATGDSNLQKDIYSESEMYGDLIQSHFQDSYNNLTLKTISLLEWVDTYCYEVRFILKTDDDMFINVPRLLAFIDKHSNDKRTIFGRLAKKWKPIRNKKSKYYVSKEQYKHVLFPDFTTGPAYLMTGDVVHDLYTSALNQTYLKLEDVYTTGIVAQEMKVKRVHVNEFLNKRIVFHPCHIQKGISIHMVKFHEQFDLWKKLLDGKTKCK